MMQYQIHHIKASFSSVATKECVELLSYMQCP